MDKISQKVAKILLEVGAVTLNPKKPYRYSSGILSPVYTDCRILISYPRERKQIRDLYIKTIKDSKVKFDIVAGTSTSGIPHASWIADKLNIPMIYARGSAKDHGKGNQVEGRLEKGQKAIVIEDLISTGESSVITAKGIKDIGGKVSYVLAIITYGMEKATKNIKENKLKLVTLTTFKDVLEVARKMGKISKKEQEIVNQWTQDTAGWGKKMGFE